MNIRRGLCGMYNGTEYAMSYTDINNYDLHSYDSASLKDGFKLCDDRLYIKHVNKRKLQHICNVHLKVDYKGHTFDVAELYKDTLYIYTNSLKISKELNLETRDRECYGKFVSHSEVYNIEENETIIESN